MFMKCDRAASLADNLTNTYSVNDLVLDYPGLQGGGMGM